MTKSDSAHFSSAARFLAAWTMLPATIAQPKIMTARLAPTKLIARKNSIEAILRAA